MAFEKIANSPGMQVLHYHADNGRFADNAFMNDAQGIEDRNIILWDQCIIIRARLKNG